MKWSSLLTWQLIEPIREALKDYAKKPSKNKK